jgi:hypothetical protein
MNFCFIFRFVCLPSIMKCNEQGFTHIEISCISPAILQDVVDFGRMSCSVNRGFIEIDRNVLFDRAHSVPLRCWASGDRCTTYFSGHSRHIAGFCRVNCSTDCSALCCIDLKGSSVAILWLWPSHFSLNITQHIHHFHRYIFAIGSSILEISPSKSHDRLPSNVLYRGEEFIRFIRCISFVEWTLLKHSFHIPFRFPKSQKSERSDLGNRENEVLGARNCDPKTE